MFGEHYSRGQIRLQRGGIELRSRENRGNFAVCVLRDHLGRQCVEGSG
jgi:hypothetical protein